MLELLTPSLPGAVRALADIARFRLKVAMTPAARKPALIAQRFMTPDRRENLVTLPALMADLKRFAPDWQNHLDAQGDLESRMTELFARMQSTELELASNDGMQTIRLYRWKPSRRLKGPARHALLSHGWESYALSYALIIERLLELGYTVHAMDHAAHGNSGGTCSGLPRFAEVLRDVAAHLEAQGIEIDLGVGHSLGAGAWLAGATKLGVKAKRLLLLAPFIDTPGLLNAWLKIHGLSTSLRPAMQEAMMALHGPSGVDFSDMTIDTLAARLTTLTTIVQDPKDFIAPILHARRLSKASRLVHCINAEGAGHVGVLFHDSALDALSDSARGDRMNAAAAAQCGT